MISRVFLQLQIWIVNCYIKCSSKNLSSVVFKTKHESKTNYFSGNTSFSVFNTENFWRNNWWFIFDVAERLKRQQITLRLKRVEIHHNNDKHTFKILLHCVFFLCSMAFLAGDNIAFSGKILKVYLSQFW